MPTQGRFVCHVHCLVHDGDVRSSPCGPHHENFGRNLYHMFVPAYSASQSLFVLRCGIRVASKSNVDSMPFLNRCSHVNTNPSRSSSFSCQSFSTCVFLFKWIRSFQHPQDQLNSSKRCSFHLFQAAFVFPPTHRFFFKDSDFLVRYPFYGYEVSPFFSVNVLTR